jgi:hypothetical protein
MVNKLNQLLTAMLLAGMSLSCEEYAPEITAAGRKSLAASATSFPVIFEETFEGPLPFYQAHNTDFSASHSFVLVKDPVYQGSRAGRFKLKASDPMISDGTRAEVTVVGDSVKKEMWYSFAVLFPAVGYEADSAKEIISQWHQMEDAHLGEKPQSPATYLVILRDNFILDVGYSKDSVSDGVNRDNRKDYDLGPVTKDTWHEFVFHFVHSIHADGLVEVWHNGIKSVSHQGGNMYNSVFMPKWKLGIYKWEWNGEDSTDTRRRILYYDNIKVGNERATLADMTPGNSFLPGPIGPDTTADYSFTLVNAETDTDIMQIKDGAILTLSMLGTNRITIRAETKLKQVGSVNFVIKGSKTFNYIDNRLPYSLFGDDEVSNYYYGTLLPPGEYSLKVYPYSGKNATGKGRPAFKTNFIIKKY